MLLPICPCEGESRVRRHSPGVAHSLRETLTRAGVLTIVVSLQKLDPSSSTTTIIVLRHVLCSLDGVSLRLR